MLDRLRDALVPGVKVPVRGVPVGGAVVVDRSPYVVTQPAPGVFRAFRRRCPHAGRPVEVGEDGAIRCPAHGSVFASDDGAPLCGPAQRALTSATVRIDGDRLIITG